MYSSLHYKILLYFPFGEPKDSFSLHKLLKYSPLETGIFISFLCVRTTFQNPLKIPFHLKFYVNLYFSFGIFINSISHGLILIYIYRDGDERFSLKTHLTHMFKFRLFGLEPCNYLLTSFTSFLTYLSFVRE